MSTLFHSQNVYINNKFQEAFIQVENEKITEIFKQAPEGVDIKSYGEHWILPGIIDSQVHFREPGLTHKEDIHHGSLSAAAGGITHFLEMPNTSPPTTTEEAILEKIEIAKKTSVTDFGFFMGATGKNLEELKKVDGIEGCCGIKIFFGSSTGTLLLNDIGRIREIFEQTTCPIAIHSEDENVLQARMSVRDKYTTAHGHPEWRNVESALSSTKQLIKIAKEVGRKIHILHISTAEEMEFLAENKDHCTVEVLPQHLTLFAPDCYDKHDTFVQMNPPIREKRHLERLWWGIEQGVVDMLGSDHAPHTKEEKLRGYPNTPAGIPGVQTMLSLMLNHVQSGKLTLQRLLELLSKNPAQLYSLNLGAIKKGKRANLTVIDPKTTWNIKDEDIKSKCGWTPYKDIPFQTQVVSTIIGGKEVSK